MGNETGESTTPLGDGGSVKRRGLLKLGTLASAITGAFALSGLSVDRAVAATTLPISENDLSAAIEFALFDSAAAEGATAEARLTTAITEAVAAKKETRIRVTEPIILTDTLVLDIGYVSLEILSGQVNAAAVVGKPAIHVLNSKSFAEENSGGIANNRRAITGLAMTGPGKSNVGSVGILFDSLVGNNRGASFYNLEIKEFETGVKLQNNSYLLSFFNYHIYRCLYGVHLPAGFVNYGENIRFIGGALGSCERAIWIENGSSNLHFISPSIDFCLEVARATAGGVFLTQPHIELNHDDSQLTGPVLVTGSARAKIVIDSGIMMFHKVPTQIPYLFETTNSFWGGGIHLSNIELFKAQPGSGYLCGGTGNLVTSHIVPYDGNGSGAGGGTIMTSKAKNKLIDGGFDAPTVVDAFLTRPEASSRTTSPSLSLAVAGGNLVATKIGGSLAQFAVDVPIEPGREYAAGWTLAGSPATGSMTVSEEFVASPTRDARGIPIVLRNSSRPSSTITFSEVKPPVEYTYISTAWSRVAPEWATHFRLNFNVLKVPAGGVVKIAEIVITGR